MLPGLLLMVENNDSSSSNSLIFKVSRATERAGRWCGQNWTSFHDVYTGQVPRTVLEDACWTSSLHPRDSIREESCASVWSRSAISGQYAMARPQSSTEACLPAQLANNFRFLFPYSCFHRVERDCCGRSGEHESKSRSWQKKGSSKTTQRFYRTTGMRNYGLLKKGSTSPALV
jgi:hypothetical protein